MFSYTAPLVLLTLLIGLFGFSKRAQISRSFLLVLSGGVSFIAGGFSETAAAVQLAALFLALVVAKLALPAAAKRRVLPAVIAATAGSLLAMVVVVIAPGNEVRQAYFPQPPSLLSLTWPSSYYALGFMARTVLRSPWEVLLSLAGPAFLAFKLHPQDTVFGAPVTPVRASLRRLGGMAALSAGLGFVLIAASVAPSVYGMSSRPPLRAQIVSQFVFVLMMVFLGYLGGLALKGTYAPSRSAGLAFRVLFCSLIPLLLLGGPVASAYRMFSVGPELRLYASSWDSRDRRIRRAVSQGETDLVVPALGYTGGLEDLNPDPTREVNGCVANYYGVNSIRAGTVSQDNFPGWMKDGTNHPRRLRR